MDLPLQAGSLAAAVERRAAGEPTAQTARDRATECLYFTGFGTICVCYGVGAWQHGSAAAYIAVSAVSVALLAMVALLFRRARELPAGEPDSDEERRARRMFAAVNIIQWVSIGTSVGILGLLHMPEYMAPAIAILAGVHLYPLAGSFRCRLHYVTGTVLVLWALGSLAVLPRERVAGIAALGAGLVLMGSAAWTLGNWLGQDAPVRSANVRA